MNEARCDLCREQPATVHYTEVEGAEVTKLFICGACARARGWVDEPPKAILALQELLAPSKPKPLPDEAPPEAHCGSCGLTYASFQRQGRLGCPACYVAFEVLLLPLLRRIHAGVKHHGKAPRAYASKIEMRQRAEDLRLQLERAVRAEDYERAAELRDALRELEKQQSQSVRRATSRRPRKGGETA